VNTEIPKVSFLETHPASTALKYHTLISNKAKTLLKPNNKPNSRLWVTSMLLIIRKYRFKQKNIDFLSDHTLSNNWASFRPYLGRRTSSTEHSLWTSKRKSRPWQNEIRQEDNVALGLLYQHSDSQDSFCKIQTYNKCTECSNWILWFREQLISR
jgi:hypothetical protein